jgi:putative endonuclease
MQRGGCVYILANVHNTVLYTGVTSNLIGRISDHKSKKFPTSFTAKYNCDKLVYYSFYPTIEEAISAEKQIKAGSRRKKEQLIVGMNPDWLDLYESLF